VTLDLAITGVAVVDPVAPFDPEQYIDPNRLRRMDPLSAMAVAAAQLAIREAGLELTRDRIAPTTGVAFGTAYGCQATELRYAARLVERGAYFTNPIDFPDSIDGAPAAHIAMELGLGGPSVTHADGRLAGELALVHAALALQNGRADRMIVVGGDSSTPALEQLAAGCVPGSHGVRLDPGAAGLVVEPFGQAVAREVTVLARLRGLGFGFEPGTRFGRMPRQSSGRERAIATALGLAELGAAEGHSEVTGSVNGLVHLARSSLQALSAGDVRAIVHHATAPGGQSVALVLTK
jgi:3-oxoacyl-(acyl-carrier-protein) synthase